MLSLIKPSLPAKKFNSPIFVGKYHAKYIFYIVLWIAKPFEIQTLWSSLLKIYLWFLSTKRYILTLCLCLLRSQLHISHLLHAVDKSNMCDFPYIQWFGAYLSFQVRYTACVVLRPRISELENHVFGPKSKCAPLISTKTNNAGLPFS